MNKYFSGISPIYYHVAACILAFVVGGVTLYCARSFEVLFPSIVNAIAYFGCFVGFPFSLLLFFWKCRPCRWYMMGMFLSVLILVSFWYYYGIIITEENPSRYLAGNTSFEVAAKMVMPEPEKVNKNTEYCHKKHNTGFESIELSLSCSEEQYVSMLLQQEQLLTQYTTDYSGHPYYFKEDYQGVIIDHHTYNCYTFNVDGVDYAVAYTGCTDSRTVHYLFFTALELSSMSVSDALYYNGYSVD